MKPNPKPSNPDALKLSTDLLKGWRRSLIKLGKVPRGFNKKAAASDQIIDALIRESRSDVAQLWSIFNQERSQIGQYLNSPKREVIAYLLGFHLPNIARYQAMLIRSHQRHQLFDGFKNFSHIHLVDLGCGTGALTLGMLDLISRFKATPKSVTIDLVDRQKEFLNSAKAIIEENFSHLPNKRIITGRLFVKEYAEKLLAQDFDKSSCIVIQLGYLLNEIQRNPKEMKALCMMIEQLIKKQLAFAVTSIDSSVPSHAKFMMNFREFCRDQGLQTVYPCNHNNPCPMFKDDRDWCYSESEWQPPREQLAIDKYLDIERRRLGSSSYMLVSPQLLDITWIKQPSQVIVGRPTAQSNGKSHKVFHYLLCSNKALEKSKQQPHSNKYQLRGEYFKDTTRC